MSNESPNVVNLREPVRKLLAEVEQMYGKEVRIQPFTPNNPDMRGLSDVAEDGTPVILLDNQLRAEKPEKTEKVIAHELLHLKLRARGFRTLFLRPPDERFNLPPVGYGVTRLNDAIHHWIFEPDMHALGVGFMEEAVTHVNNQFTGEGLPVFMEMSDSELGFVFFHFMVEIRREPQKLEPMFKWAQRSGRTAALRRAEAMYELVNRRNPASAEAQLSVMVECANILYAGELRFIHFETRQLQSGRHTRYHAGIFVSPFR
jgi:hypothetical protein